MSKRIIVCADGTWNRPEEDVESDQPTNVLRLARAIRPWAGDDSPQHVFYDWGIGSYHARIRGGMTGRGIHKNIMDGYRYIVQNYTPGAQIYLFGFSRGAYTVRALCGLINNCGILKRPDANRIQQAFEHYKKEGPKHAPEGAASIAFRKQHAHPSRAVQFVGVWDTVGALGVPISFLGLFDRTDEFYDTKLGRNVSIARHALAIDEQRRDFEPTIWQPREGLDLKQVWFAGAHSDIGGGYAADKQGRRNSDFALRWMMREAEAAGLKLEPHLKRSLNDHVQAPIHRSRRHVFRARRPLHRPLHDPKAPTSIHRSVKRRYEIDSKYRPKNLAAHLEQHGWADVVE